MRRIGVLGEAIYGWGGGADLLLDFGKALNYTKKEKHKEIDLFLFMPRESPIGCFLRDVAVWFHNKFQGKLVINSYKQHLKQLEIVVNNYENFCPEFKIIYYRRIRFWKIDNKLNDLKKSLKYHKIDVCFPRLFYENDTFLIPNMTYIPDFQHKYMPELFPEEERKWLSQHFDYQVMQSDYILVTSLDTQKDINKFYPNHVAKIFSMPFCPICDESWLKKSVADIEEYKLPDRYFVISNQFWKHKSHITAFLALEHLFNAGDETLHIVCTGKMEDYRDENYIDDLLQEIRGFKCRQNIHFLGYIPKMNQIQIVKNAIGLIQMTLYEGNPGGNCVLDAISVGTPCILSDIPINLEIEGYPLEEVCFFKAKDSFDLSIKMEYILKNGRRIDNEEQLTQRMYKNKENLADSLLAVLEEVRLSFDKGRI